MTAKKLLTLSSIPLRLGGAAVMVFLAYQFPYFVLMLLILAVLAGSGGLALSVVLRRAFRMRSRTRCIACDYHPLGIARICPKCHTPLLAAAIRDMPPPVAAAVLDAAIALAWASGDVADEERAYLAALLKASKIAADQQGLLSDRIGQGLAIDSLVLPELKESEAESILRTAAAVVTVDGQLVPAEEQAYQELSRKLGVADKAARQMLQQQRKLAWA